MFKVELLNSELIRLHEATHRVMDSILKGFSDNNRYLVEKMLDQSQARLVRNYDLIEIYLRECDDDGDDDEPDESEDEEEKEDKEAAQCCRLLGVV